MGLPVSLTNANTQAFVLPASYDRLAEATNKWLNAVPDSDYSFLPLLPYVHCTAVWIEHVGAGATDRDRVRASDLTFGWLVVCFRKGELDHLAMAISYAVTDDAATFAGDHDIFGRTVIGSLDYVAGTYQPGGASDATGREIAGILNPPGWPYATKKAKQEDLEQIAQLVAGDLALTAAVAVEHLLALFRSQNVPIVNVTGNGNVLVESQFQITNLKSAWSLPAGQDGFSVSLSDSTLASDLGLATGSTASALAYQCNFDAVLHPARVLAGAGRTDPS